MFAVDWKQGSRANIVVDGGYSMSFKLRTNLWEKNRILRETRDLLLPKLISGEIDISDIDIAV